MILKVTELLAYHKLIDIKGTKFCPYVGLYIEVRSLNPVFLSQRSLLSF